MKKFTDKIKQMWEEEPEKVIVLGILALGVTVKLVNAYNDHQRTIIWDREVDRRRMMQGSR